MKETASNLSQYLQIVAASFVERGWSSSDLGGLLTVGLGCGAGRSRWLPGGFLLPPENSPPHGPCFLGVIETHDVPLIVSLPWATFPRRANFCYLAFPWRICGEESSKHLISRLLPHNLSTFFVPENSCKHSFALYSARHCAFR